MIEVPITMALVMVAIIIGLGLFALVVIGRYTLNRFAGESDEKKLPAPRQVSTALTPVPETTKENKTTVLVKPEVQPLLVVGSGNGEENGKKLVWRVEEPYRLLRRGLLSRSDEALLRECAGEIKNLLAVDEILTESESTAPPAFLVLPTPIPESKPSRNVFNLLGREKVVAEEPLSMALQMNAILQEMLKTLPGEPINLRIEDGPQGDLRIWYQSKAYHGLEELPDPGIQDLIRKAADAWLAKNANRR